ncbi:MAG: PTS sugar transporter subunit IIA [Spirochaetales bacterium]
MAVTFSGFLSENRVVFLDATSKTEALRQMVSCLEDCMPAFDAEDLLSRLLERERLMSTGIGLGIGVPHLRYKGVKEPCIVVGIQPKGIGDYESLDGEIVKILLLILVDAGQHREYLRILSGLVKTLKKAGVREALLAASNPEEVVSILRREDG